MVGKQVQQYTFLEKLGAGGMGDIFRAQDTRLNRFVAIKVLTGSTSGDPDRRRRFIQEAQAASALNHPNIITIHDILTEGDSQYMVMEHVQGKTLADLIPKGGLRVPQVLRLAMQMTDALQVAHSAGIIHRDLKPGNVMVTDTGLVKVLDFGLAKLADPSPVTQNDATKTMGPAPLTVEGSIIGTVSYMSPEQAQGKKVDTRSDVFSLGLVLYEMITGNRAFQGETAVETLSAILRDDPRPIPEVAPDVPAKLEQVVSKSLKKSPDERFQTMRDMHQALSALKHESDSGVLYRSVVMGASQIQMPPKVDPIEAKKSEGGTRMALVAVGAFAVVALIAGVAWMMTRPSGPSEAPQAVAETPAVATPTPDASAAVVADKTLTNDTIIEMVKGKVPQDVIFSQIRTDTTNFNLSAGEVIRLTQEGVPVAVIEAMRDPKTAGVASAKSGAKSTAAATSNKAPSLLPGPPAAVPPPAPMTSTEVVMPRPAAPPAASSGPSRQLLLSDGSPFSILLAADIPEDAKPGYQLKFTVREDVKVGDTVVIAKGAQATGEVTQGKRLLGKMQLRLLTVEAVDKKSYSIRALSSRTNKNQERAVDTGVKPKNDKVAADAGTQYIAYVDGDMQVTVRGR